MLDNEHRNAAEDMKVTDDMNVHSFDAMALTIAWCFMWFLQ
jgi:hypothetical protein